MNGSNFSLGRWQWLKGRGTTVAIILVIALIGFEIFNYDTTKFALMNLMGGIQFFGMEWAAILSFAFCSIDFAGVIRMFTPEQTMKEEPREIWLLMGAWLVGASMNAVMTWYAVALTIAPRNVGASIINKQDMLLYAPIFVAILVWLTRVLFIGSISVTADRLMNRGGQRHSLPRGRPKRAPRHHRHAANNREEPVVDDMFEI